MAQDRDAPAVVMRAAEGPAVPLIVCSPHSGRHYPASFLADSRLELAALRRSEDSFVDELFGDAPSLGASLLAANFARSFIDVNREPYELDPATFAEPLPPFVNTGSTRVASGFGTIAQSVAGGGPIYRRKLAFAEAEVRLRDYYRPYHERLAGLVSAVQERFGRVLLLDCHSMPSAGSGDRGASEIDVVLGDRFGRSCDARVIDDAERSLLDSGLRVRRNDPYAGGFTTEYYGRPHQGIHALQIEINRALYMDEARFERAPGFARVRAAMRRLLAALAGLRFGAMAAE
ncbi:MAG: N-formylglutamate amidohydrolase [Alphaproteobacteria bacterium]|nr:N-formylglutamate amidohydrolase [Alphaproteobacteria bacterium]